MSKILVIEDEVQVRENIQQILELSDYFTLSAEDGLKGVKLAQDNQPDLIICDIMMPKMNGYGVLDEIRKNPVTSTIPLIFLTAKSERSDMRQGMELGADDYLTKPFTAEELLKSINTRLSKLNAIVAKYQEKVDQAELKADYLSYHDSVTGLPNQFFLQREFNRLKRLADRHHQHIPLLIMGFPQFNHINLILGNGSVNSLIQAMAKRLTWHFTNLNAKSPQIIHLGGERFLLMGDLTSQPKENVNLAQNCLNALCHSFEINHHEIFITPNIGLISYPQDGDNLDLLLTHGEIARHQAQKIGGNHYQVYTEQLSQNADRKLALESDLHYALDQNEFFLDYQPQVDLWTGRIVGIEALIRWHHPKLGLISPVEFIPIAEETGLIIPIGEWVLRTICCQIKSWQNVQIESFKVAVNLSAYQFRQPNLCEIIQEMIEEYQINPQMLELELTESAIVDNFATAANVMSQLKALGIAIAIDDFGTGYSSLQYLQSLHFDTIKIDKTFIKEVHKNNHNMAITKAIFQIAEALSLKVIAEGIETEEELGFLRLHHCQFGQGYLFHKPLSEEQLALLLCLSPSKMIQLQSKA
jgi:diguanylate cyclase